MDAYAFLEECYNRTLLDHDSISSTIMNSVVISDWFADNVAKSEVGSGNNIRNLSFKRHRLDGQTKPAGRIVLYFDAVLRTAQQIGVHRRGTKAGKCADAYLRSAVL